MVRLLAVLVSALATNSWSQTLFDSFDGTSVDSLRWNIVLPFYDSSVAVQGGALSLKDRGSIATTSQFLSPYEVSGTFINNNPRSVFFVTLRSDGTTVPDGAYPQIYRQFQGVQISFWADQAWPDNMVAINTTRVHNPDWYSTSFPLTSSSQINFKIRDDGSKIWIEVNNAFITEFTTSYSFGGKIGLASRENSRINLHGSGDVTVLDFNVVPEPTSLSLLFAGGAAALSRRRKS